ncbi:MAG: tetratricopeptide repeat protein [Candidatus Competibacteraceae bacterium]|nr:tetratricopeptide repeat protein [Candidatus Competibacteraceae bacterium]
MGLGHVHMERQQHAEAEAAFRAVLAINPRRRGALIALGQLARRQGQRAAALELFEAARAADRPSSGRTSRSRRSCATAATLRPRAPCWNRFSPTARTTSTPACSSACCCAGMASGRLQWQSLRKQPFGIPIVSSRF